MGNFAEFLILGLVVWRITSLLVYEQGPFDMFGKFRAWIGVRYNAESIPYGESVLSKMFACFWCCSFWASLIIAPFCEYSAKFHKLGYLLVVLGLSALAILIDSHMVRDNHA